MTTPTTLGTIVDVLTEVPEAISLVSRLVERIKNARGEDRALLLAELEKVGESSHHAFERAAARLEQRFPAQVPAQAQPGDKTEPGDAS